MIAGGLALAGVGFALLTQVDADSRAGHPGDRVRRLRPRARSGVHAGGRPDGRDRAAGAGRGGRGDLGDELRVRRRARHRRARHRRHRRLPRPDRGRGPGGRPARGGRGRARHARRRGGGRRRAPGRGWPPSWWTRPARRSPRHCSWPPASAPRSRSARPSSPRRSSGACRMDSGLEEDAASSPNEPWRAAAARVESIRSRIAR